MPVARLRELGAVPSYYLRYYYAFDEVLAEQRNGHSRAEEVMGLERQLLDMYADPTLDTKPALLNDRGGAFYSEAAAQLLASLHDGAGDVQVVDVRNGEAIAGLGADDVVEVPARIDREGAHPVSQPPMSDEMLALVRAAKDYERLAIRAALSGAREDARLALEANPLVGPRIGDVTPLLDALLEANRPHLPRFRGLADAGGTRAVAHAARDREIPTPRSSGSPPHPTTCARWRRPSNAVAAAVGHGRRPRHLGPCRVYAQYLIETHLGLPSGLAKPSVTTVYGAPIGVAAAACCWPSRSPARAPTSSASSGGARGRRADDRDHQRASARRLAAAAEFSCAATPAGAGDPGHEDVRRRAGGRGVAGRGDSAGRAPSSGRPGGPAGSAARHASADRCLARRRRRGAGASPRGGDRALLVSRGYNLATTLELALKLKETCGLFAEAYSTADFAHGPLVLAQPAVPTSAIRPDGAMGALVDETLATWRAAVGWRR